MQSYAHLTDAHLVNNYIHGDEKSLEILVYKHKSKIYNFILVINRWHINWKDYNDYLKDFRYLNLHSLSKFMSKRFGIHALQISLDNTTRIICYIILFDILLINSQQKINISYNCGNIIF